MKRLLDFIAALLGLIALALPLLLLIALIRRKLGSPVFFRQIRPGLHGQPFEMVKFRTMTDACGPDGTLLPDAERLTPFGHFLRSTSLDELPELWNVLKGDMSLVGPRPIVGKEVEKYGPVYEEYCLVRPGLTGLWQISGRNNTTYAERVAFDHYYINNWSVWMDLWILAKTIPVVITGYGAY